MTEASLRNLEGYTDTASEEPQQAVPRKDQYDALFRFYTEENDRYEALNKRGSAYLGVVGGLSVFTLFKLDAIAAKILSSTPTLILGLLTGGAILACILIVTFSLRIRDYSTLVDPRALVTEIGSQGYGSEDMYTLLLAGLVVAIEKNRKMNDERAEQLVAAVWFAVAAIVLSVLTNAAIFTLNT